MNVDFENDTKADAVRDVAGKTYRDQDNVEFLVQAPLGDGLLNAINLATKGPYQARIEGSPGARMMIDGLALERGLSSGSIVEVHRVDVGALGRFGADMNVDEILAQDPKAKAKLTVVKELAERGLSKDSPRLSRAVTDIWKKHGFDEEFGERPETKTVRTWFKGDPETLTVHDLASKSGRVKRRSRVDAAVEPILEASAEYFYDRQGLRFIDCRAKLASDGAALNAERAQAGLPKVPIPSRETLRRRIAAKLDREHYVRKYGEAAARKNFDGHGIGLVAQRIGQLGVMDDTVFDGVACFDGERGLPAGRPYLCLLVDVASRCIVGYLLSFEPPTAHTALETVRAASRYNRVPKELLDKYPVLERINCLFEEIVVDRGSNYTSTAFGQAMLDVGTTVRLARVRHARDKAIVERIFHTLKTYLVEKLPGATFAPKLMREFEYDPEKVACLTVSEFCELVEHFIAVYHIAVHSGIGMQPALFWNRSLNAHGRRLLGDHERFGILAGETLYNVRFDREGTMLDGIRYVHETNVAILLDAMAGGQAAGTVSLYAGPPSGEEPDVGRRAGGRKRRRGRSAGLGDNPAWATVKVKRNTANLLRIHAFVPGHGWLPFTAANDEYADGLSLYQHRKIGEWAAKRNMAFSSEEEQLIARHALVEHVRELAPEMATRERRATARMTREGRAPSKDVQHVFQEEDPIILVDPIDERDDALLNPNRKRRGKHSGSGDAKMKPNTTIDDAAVLLEQLRGLDWSSPVDEDQVMEEHA